MSAPQRNLLLGLVSVLAMGFAAGTWWLIQTPPPAVASTGVTVAPTPPEGAPPGGEPPEVEGGTDRTPTPLEPAAPEAVAPTTVVFPLKVELELLASAVRPSADGVSAMGSDATARIAGSVHGAAGEGLSAEILFVAGANAGRRLATGRDGTFGTNDLYPGLSVVRITSSGTPGSLRQVLLRKDRETETQLNVGYGRLGVVQGAVRDLAGDPIPDAKVTVDGQETRTDEKGEFLFTGVAAGETFAIAEKPGYAARMERLTVAGAQTIEKGRLNYVLRPGSRLEVTIEERINVEGEALLYVLPQVLDAERDFPWYRVNPVRLYPGGTKVVEDLPSKAVTLRLFHSGAVATPPTRSVTLKERDTEHVELHLAPAPIVNGTVTQGGRPVPGAEVVLEAPQRSAAMLSVLGQSNYLELEEEVLPDFPPAVQRAKTNGAGEFVLTSGEGASRERYLHATSPDGKHTAWKLLRGGETRVDLVLERAQGDSELILRMDGRTQGLPVEVKIDGSPRDLQILSPGRDLHTAGLAPGTWRLTVRWNGEALVDGMIFDLRQETTLSVTLPEGAIVGQDADTRKRSGK